MPQAIESLSQGGAFLLECSEQCPVQTNMMSEGDSRIKLPSEKMTYASLNIPSPGTINENKKDKNQQTALEMSSVETSTSLQPKE